MSYIKCKSFITDKEVDYGLIEVELSHKPSGNKYGSYSDYYVGRYNTCPSFFRGQVLTKNSSGKYIYSSVATGGITGRNISSGILTSNYGYVTRGKHPVISNSVYNVDNMDPGENVFKLFETDNVLVTLKCVKFKVSEFNSTTATYSFYDIDGNIVSDPYLIGSIVIEETLKSNNKIISQLNLLQTNPQSNLFFNKFAVNTELFCIKNFVPNYMGNDLYESRIDLWYTGCNNIRDCKLLVDGSPTSSSGDFVGLVFSVFASDYYVTSRNNYNYHRALIVDSNNSEVDDSFIKQSNTKAQTEYYLDCIDNNSSEFIVFSGQNNYLNSNYSVTDTQKDFAESLINGDKSYKTKTSDQDYDTIFRDNFCLSPILAPFVDVDYNIATQVTSGIFIPLTNTIYEGDPEIPDDPDEETIEKADDPETDFTPSLPGDVDLGEETWSYPDNDIIGGDPGAYNLFRPSYSNFVFKKYYKSTSDWDQDSAWEFINDCMNTSASEFIHTTYSLVTGKPELSEIVTRVFDLPFEYDELITVSAGIREASPIYGYIGPLTFEFGKDGKPVGDARYYKELANRFFKLELGTLNIQKVFNNYLDYTDTKYTLNLPYGAGIVDIDPSALFNLGVVTANIKLVGYLDIDTGLLIIKVKVNNQLYYETSVNVAVDRAINANSTISVASSIGKGLIGLGATLGTRGLIRNYIKTNEAEERYQYHRQQRREDQRERDKEIIERDSQRFKEKAEISSKRFEDELNMRLSYARELSNIQNVNIFGPKKGDD